MSKLKLEKKINKLESQSQRQIEKVSLLLQQVEELTKLNQKLLLLVEESLYENDKNKSVSNSETKIKSHAQEPVHGKVLKELIQDKLIFN